MNQPDATSGRGRETTANFSAGPASMPTAVLESIQRDLLDYRGTGMSVMEMSHRSAEFSEIAETTERDLRALLNLPSSHHVLFMQGGATAQFSLLVQNLDHCGHVAHARLGYWSAKAIREASRLTRVSEVCEPTRDAQGRLRVPEYARWSMPDGASYLHLTDNETIDGIELSGTPDVDTPLVCDMSSNMLSRPFDATRYGLVYAGAQKNLGPAGITVVIIREDLLERSRAVNLPGVFRYSDVADAGSRLNTPPTFAWYAMGMVFQWLLEQGGLSGMAERNRRQADRVYAALDRHSCFSNTVHPEHRSRMNLPFSLSRPDLLPVFLSGAADAGLVGLKGHKSVGGCRASLYNATTDRAVDQLIDYLDHFASRFA